LTSAGATLDFHHSHVIPRQIALDLVFGFSLLFLDMTVSIMTVSIMTVSIMTVSMRWRLPVTRFPKLYLVLSRGKNKEGDGSGGVCR